MSTDSRETKWLTRKPDRSHGERVMILALADSVGRKRNRQGFLDGDHEGRRSKNLESPSRSFHAEVGNRFGNIELGEFQKLSGHKQRFVDEVWHISYTAFLQGAKLQATKCNQFEASFRIHYWINWLCRKSHYIALLDLLLLIAKRIPLTKWIEEGRYEVLGWWFALAVGKWKH